MSEHISQTDIKTELKGVPSSRGLYTESGIQLISTPTVAQIENLSADPRLKYFTTLGDQPEFVPDEVKPSLKESLNQTASPYFLQYCLDPLNAGVRQEVGGIVSAIGGTEVGIRATACSLSGPLEEPRISYFGKIGQIRSIEQILREGSDTGLGETNVYVIDFREPDLKPVSGFFTQTYLHYYARMLRFVLRTNSMDESAVFPLVLIYDSKFISKDLLKIKLPVPTEERSKSIVKAYILDYPMY